jgi:hypothetical protein
MKRARGTPVIAAALAALLPVRLAAETEGWLVKDTPLYSIWWAAGATKVKKAGPLPPYEGPFAAPAGENCPLWVTVYVPPAAPAGDYRGTVSLSSEAWPSAVVVPVRLHVWSFTLPATPSIRSSFGLVASDIAAYHNLTSRQELEKVYDLYMENFRAHRVAPTSFADLYPMDARFKGIPWQGGEFVTDAVHGGRRALRAWSTSARMPPG